MTDVLPAKDLLLVIAYAVPATACVAAAGGALLYLLRRRSLRLLQTLAAVITVLATLAGIVVVSEAMLISKHDFTVVMVVVAVSVLAGFVSAWLLGRNVARDTADLADAAQAVGHGYRAPRALPVELARVSDRLAATDGELTDAREREAALEESRRDLVVWMSHDLRTPLAGIRAMAEALEDGIAASPETVGRYHAQIKAETDRLSDMVDDLFELSRIHAGSLPETRHDVGVCDLVADAVASVTPVASAEGVEIVGGSGADAVVSVDPEGIGRVLRNLLVNAVRHTPAGESVEITTSVHGDTAHVSVADTCGGIPADELPHVFDVAYRGETARTPSSRSRGGLGLAIAHGIVDAHAGSITVANTDRGCCFEVALPTGQ